MKSTTSPVPRRRSVPVLGVLDADNPQNNRALGDAIEAFVANIEADRAALRNGTASPENVAQRKAFETACRRDGRQPVGGFIFDKRGRRLKAAATVERRES